jgi:hypothetical protein
MVNLVFNVYNDAIQPSCSPGPHILPVRGGFHAQSVPPPPGWTRKGNVSYQKYVDIGDVLHSEDDVMEC